jgi:hypothetical protein
MQSLLIIVFFVVAGVLAVRAMLARVPALAPLLANQKTADGLTDEKLERFLVFWKVRDELSQGARPFVLQGLQGNGYRGVVDAGSTPSVARIFAEAEEKAAAESGLTVKEGMALFFLLSNHYLSVHSAMNRDDVDAAGREADLASRREQFGRLYGAAALELVTRHEAQFLPLVAKQMEAFKEDLRAQRSP